MSTNSTKPKGRRWFARARLAVLLVGLGAALLLLYWSRQHDPRFYWFVQTPPGRVIAGTLHWQIGTRPLPPDESPEAWTDEERMARDRLLARMQAIRPEVRLQLDDGRTLEGRVVEEDGRRVVLEVKYDEELGVRMTLEPDQIATREDLDASPVPLSRRDVQFHLEFPEYGFFRRPPFTIVTDRSAFAADDAIAMLHRLHEALINDLSDLMRSNGSTDGIQLLFFSNEAAYRAYAERLSSHLEFSSGFYSPTKDRLVWFDQAGSFEAKAARQHIEAEADRIRQRAWHPDHHKRIDQAAQRARQHLHQATDSESRRVLRHEGAHQLFFTFGIHSDHYAENAWLIEGLAQYYEERPPGRIPRQHHSALKGPLAEGDPLSVERLLTLRSIKGLHALEDPELITLGYIRSAALVRWLMHPDRRPGFTVWLKELRDPKQVWRAATADQTAWLAGHLDMTSEEMVNRMRGDAFDGP